MYFVPILWLDIMSSTQGMGGHTQCPWVDHAHLLNLSVFPEEFLCTEDQVLDLISSLDSKKACGAEGMAVKKIKATAPSIVCSRTRLFNRSLKTVKGASDW